MTMQKPQEPAPENKPKTRDRTIDVDGMKDESSISKVSEALKAVASLTVESVKLGLVTLRAATRDDVTVACTAIKTAGYESRATPRPAAATP